MFLRKSMMILLCMVAFLSSCNNGEVQESSGGEPPQGIPVRVENPQIRKIIEWDEFTGRFQARQRIEIRAHITGNIQAITFEDGQIVEEDDVLFIIDQRPYEIAVASAAARFELANNRYNRARASRDSGAISEEAYDQNLQEMRIARASLDKARLDLDYTEVKAPFGGRISRHRLSVGSLVSGNSANATVLTTIVSLTPIEFYFEVSENYFLKYLNSSKDDDIESNRNKDIPIFLRLQTENGFPHEGKINFFDNELAQDTGTIQMRAVFENQDNTFVPGMFGRIRIPRGEAADTVLVEQGIIGTEQNLKYVYALDAENKAVRKYVEIGSIADDGLRVIRSGLSQDDKIIVGGLHMVRPGAQIAPIEDQAG